MLIFLIYLGCPHAAMNVKFLNLFGMRSCCYDTLSFAVRKPLLNTAMVAVFVDFIGCKKTWKFSKKQFTFPCGFVRRGYAF